MASFVVQAACPTTQISVVEASLRELPEVTAVGLLRSKRRSKGEDMTTIFITFSTPEAANSSSEQMRKIAGLVLGDETGGDVHGVKPVKKPKESQTKSRQSRDLAAQFLAPLTLAQPATTRTWRGKKAEDHAAVVTTSMSEKIRQDVAAMSAGAGRPARATRVVKGQDKSEASNANRRVDGKPGSRSKPRANKKDRNTQPDDSEDARRVEVAQGETARRQRTCKSRQQHRVPQTLAPPLPPPPPFEANVAFVDNIPFSTPNDRIMEMFSPFGRVIDVNRLEMMAMICYDNPQSVQDCIQHLNGKSMGQNCITVSSGTVRIPSQIVAHIGLNSSQ